MDQSKQYAIHCPDFYDSFMKSNVGNKVEAKTLAAYNWVTEALKSEIKLYSPTDEDKITDGVNHNITLDRQVFEKHCKAMFPCDRIFVNITQLDQVANFFGLHGILKRSPTPVQLIALIVLSSLM